MYPILNLQNKRTFYDLRLSHTDILCVRQARYYLTSPADASSFLGESCVCDPQLWSPLLMAPSCFGNYVSLYHLFKPFKHCSYSKPFCLSAWRLDLAYQTVNILKRFGAHSHKVELCIFSARQHLPTSWTFFVPLLAVKVITKTLSESLWWHRLQHPSSC